VISPHIIVNRCSHEVLVCFAQPRAFRFESEVIFSVSFSVVRSEAAAGRVPPNTPSEEDPKWMPVQPAPIAGREPTRIRSCRSGCSPYSTGLAWPDNLPAQNSCETCHGTGGSHGTVAAPGLAGTASILPTSVLEDLLRHHSIQMQKGGMPLTNMNPPDMKANRRLHSPMPASAGP
jgi:hypothetical protein